tara:strand:+ start:8958 stop:9800 length:843 start_codon:yes stop_codon:yes gene_type:complete
MNDILTQLSSQNNELFFLWSALVFYVCSGSLAITTIIVWRNIPKFVPYLTCLGFTLHTLAIALRWYRLDHGPFVTMFEILSSNIWSFTLVWLFIYWKIKEVRFALVIALPILFMMMAWMLLAQVDAPVFPATYQTIWLYIHVGFGKVFLAFFYIAVALSILILLRQFKKCRTWLNILPANQNLALLSFRFVAIGLIFETLMLIAGAIWAQDAWGRYWAWDSLETWSFISWLLVALLLHARVTWKIKPEISSIMIIIVFIIAFITFFGVPFISMTPHRGVI